MIARYEVKGHSMEPALKDGDRVVVLKTKNVKEKDMIVFIKEKTLIKRVASLNGNTVFVEGDNKQSSTDSRHYGEVSKDNIIGKVIMKY